MARAKTITITGGKDHWIAKCGTHTGEGHGPLSAVRDLFEKMNALENTKFVKKLKLVP